MCVYIYIYLYLFIHIYSALTRSPKVSGLSIQKRLQTLSERKRRSAEPPIPSWRWMFPAAGSDDVSDRRSRRLSPRAEDLPTAELNSSNDFSDRIDPIWELHLRPCAQFASQDLRPAAPGNRKSSWPPPANSQPEYIYIYIYTHIYIYTYIYIYIYVLYSIYM